VCTTLFECTGSGVSCGVDHYRHNIVQQVIYSAVVDCRPSILTFSWCTRTDDASFHIVFRTRSVVTGYCDFVSNTIIVTKKKPPDQNDDEKLTRCLLDLNTVSSDAPRHPCGGEVFLLF